VLGHVLPLHRRLRGGKGVATAGGGALVLHPLVAVVLLVVFAVVVRVGGRASVGSLTMAVGLPLLVLAERRSGWEVLVAAAIALVVVLRHRANIRRLVAHEEPAYRPG
jgi:glycerol-3-phosphate acyltransferase PlsY